MPRPLPNPLPPRPRIIWSIAGHDTSGGAGLSADQRAADAMDVHLCPVVASITAQHSLGVQAVYPVTLPQLEAQLTALANDMPPAVIKTGLLGQSSTIELVAKWIDHLRLRNPDLVLVVDPVLGASSGGAAFCDDAVLWTVRRELLPRATLITPNRAEARRLLGLSAVHNGPDDDAPRLSARLRQMGAKGVAITGGDAPHPDWAMDWLDVPQAQGWLCSPRVPTVHHHGSGCTFATAAAAALARGHSPADAVVLAKMLTHQALQQAHAAGEGAGPVHATAASPLGPLPYLGLGQQLPWQLTLAPHERQAVGAPLFLPFDAPSDGLYGILPDSRSLADAAQAGVRCLQLRHKAREGAMAHIQDSAHVAAQHGATLFINDHWQDALTLVDIPGLKLGLHLGQEDMLALSLSDRKQLLAARHKVVLGVSTHSLWELARAAGCGASAVACGPVQSTITKDMPWTPQGERNLSWWVTHSPAPVLAIGGLLTLEDLARFAACGPATLCVVRGLGATPAEIAQRVPALQAAIAAGRAAQASPVDHANSRLTLPHPVL
ncbi:MAG: bifunctional hydroxymethylpyrimidine kinase/phosphomethylpyrimidine kinase [Aquabacterium sp.]|nr:bifunctional hydroxymethylpyrimidine kinase/phosphomethylpyrimidine kinase [Aquabacterium sp.]